MYKFGSLNQSDWQMMYDLAKMFLYCFNHWKLETPSVHVRSTPSDNQRSYKENYARYVYMIVYLKGCPCSTPDFLLRVVRHPTHALFAGVARE